MPRPWKRLAKEIVLETMVFDVERHQLQSPRTETEHTYWILDPPDWCNVVAITPRDELVMVKQRRHGTDEVTLEVPGGMVDWGEAPRVAAERELLEETGFIAKTWIATGEIAPNPAMQTNRCHSFVALDVEPTAASAAHAGQDSGEDIEVVLIPMAELEARVLAGEITHSLVIVALVHAFGLGPAKRPNPQDFRARTPAPRTRSKVR